MKFNIRFNSQSNLKWNISILIIFVLLISGLIGVLTMNFIKDMLGYTNDIYSYNKAYYQANAGMELALTEIDNAGIWFSNSIDLGDEIFSDNFDCIDCELEMNLEWKTQYLSDKFWLGNECGDDNKFVLLSGGSVVIPLFTQLEPWNHADILPNNPIDPDVILEYDKDILNYTDNFNFESEDFSKDFNIWLFVLSGNDIQTDLIYIKSLQWRGDMIKNYFDAYKDYYVGEWVLENEDYFMYLIISNVENDEVSFCVNMDLVASPHWNWSIIELPTMNYFVNSLARYGDKTVWLQAIYRQPIPDFLINSFN